MDLAQLQNKLSSLQSKGTKKEKVDYSTIYWKPSIGKQQIRIVPSAFTPDNPFTDLKMYYGIGNKMMISPLNFGEADPIAQFAQKLRESEYSKEKYVLAKKLDPKVRTFVPVIVRGEEDKGVRLWQFGKTIYEELLALALDEEVGDYTDISEGRDFTIETVGPESTGTNYNKSMVRPKMKTSQLSEDPAQVEQWLENQPNPVEQFKRYSFDEMKAALGKWLEPADSEDDKASESSSTPPPPPAKPNYSLDTNKAKQAKGDQFEALFGDQKGIVEDDLPF